MLHGSKCVLSQPPGPHAIYDVQAWKPAHAPFKKEVHNDIIHRYFLPGSDIQTPPLTGDTYRTSRWQVLGFHNLRANRLKESTSTPNWAPNWKGCSRSNPRSHYLGCFFQKRKATVVNLGKAEKATIASRASFEQEMLSENARAEAPDYTSTNKPLGGWQLQKDQEEEKVQPELGHFEGSIHGLLAQRLCL